MIEEVLASRASLVAELVVVTAATALLAVSPAPRKAKAPPRAPVLHVVHVELRSLPARPAPPHACDGQLPAALDAKYRDRRFAEVAAALGSCNDGELMRDLDRAYAIERDATADLGRRFEAVRTAYRLDTVFGGAHVDELARATATIASGRAHELLASHDRAAARQVVATTVALGLQSDDLRALEHSLAR